MPCLLLLLLVNLNFLFSWLYLRQDMLTYLAEAGWYICTFFIYFENSISLLRRDATLAVTWALCVGRLGY